MFRHTSESKWNLELFLQAKIQAKLNSAQIDIDHNGKLNFYEFTMLMNDKLVEEEIDAQIKQVKY